MRVARPARLISAAVCTVLMVVGATFGVGAPAAVGAPEPGGAVGHRKIEEIPLADVERRFVSAPADPNRSVSVMVELAGEPVAVADSAAAKAGAGLTGSQRAQRRATLESAQDALAPQITRLGGQVRAKLQDAYNGIRVRIAAKQVAELAKLPGVKAVRPIELATPENAGSIPFLQVPGVWQSLGLTGKGIRVGIIDTGIDYYHANFGGSGNPADYAADDRRIVEPGTFPTARVVGGTDFVGDAYDPQSSDPARRTPVPDPDPLDCSGHGSHVAGTAAGNGVRIDKSAYRGPYGSTTHNNGFLIGPGVAPEATLYALKIFGCTGGTATDATVDAIDWAVEHDLDVINLSTGSALGRLDDPASVAATNAALAGVVVVASAGNSGRGPYISNTPAAGAGAISVAAMDWMPGYPLVEFVTATERIPMLNANGSTSLPLGGAVRLLADEPGTAANESFGCSLADYATVQPGDIVVTHRGGCTGTDRVLLGTAANAAAVVMINTTPGVVPPFEGHQGGAIPLLGADPASEPGIVAAAGSTASVEPAGQLPRGTAGKLPDFSSSGPRNGDSGLKPDIAAPGIDIVSTRAGTGYGALSMAGTSMAAPHVTGVAALVRQARPSWTAVQVKAAIINTADPNQMFRGGSNVPFGQFQTVRAGSGLIVPADALRTEVVAMGEPAGGGLSFGLAESTGVLSSTRTVTLTNLGKQAVTYNVSADVDTRSGSPSLSFSPSRVTVPSRGGTAQVNVTLRVDASQVPAGEGDPALVRTLATAAGNVLLTPTKSERPILRVPFLTVVRGISSISTTPRSVPVADEASFTTSADAGVIGPVEVYAWGLSDPAGDTSHPSATDLLNVGVQTYSDGIGVFTMHTAKATSNPSVNEWELRLNTDSDAEADYAVVGRDSGVALLGGEFSGNNLAALTVDLETGNVVRAFIGFTSLNSGVVQLPFDLADVGLAAGAREEFSYTARVISQEEGFGEDAADGVARYNAFTPPVQTNQFFAMAPGVPPSTWTATIDRAQLAKTPVKGWLVVYRYNKGGPAQVDAITLGAAQTP